MGAKQRALLAVEPRASALAPNQHARLLIEFLKRPDLGRRWMGAFASVDPARRAALVAEVERLVSERYGESEVEVTVVRPPVQRKGYVEQTETVYRVRRAAPTKAPASSGRKRAAR